MDVRLCPGAQVRELQLRVLRPHGRLDTDTEPGPGSWHLGAFDSDGTCVGACTVAPEAWPRPDLRGLRESSAHLRSVAVADGRRGQGIGRALVDRAALVGVQRGYEWLWAEARVPVLGFYTGRGWTVLGDEWMKPGVGPHRYVVMRLAERRITAAPGVGRDG